MGKMVLQDNTTGGFNIAIGYEPLKDNIDGDNNVAIGNQVLWRNGSTGTAADNNVGIGNQVLNFNVIGTDNIGIGFHALYNALGSDNIAIGKNAGDTLTSGSNAVVIGSGSDVAATGTNEIVIGYSVIGNGSNTITLGNSSITEFHCQVALTVDSDKRIKENINSLNNDSMLSFINNLNPVTFNKKNPADWDEEIRNSRYDKMEKPLDNPNMYVGLIAQEIEEVLDKYDIDYPIVNTNKQTGLKSVTYEAMIPALISAVQVLSNKINVLENS